MWMTLLLVSSLDLAASRSITTVTGFIGLSVEIKCHYESGYETYTKYLCRGECPYGYNKDIPVGSGAAAEDERFSLHDDTTARVFTITITDLRLKDEGKYWCGIQRTLLTDIYTDILLLVRKGHKQNNSYQQTDISAAQRYDSLIYVSLGLIFLVLLILVAVVVMCRANGEKRKAKAATESMPPVSVKEDERIYQEIDDQKPDAIFTVNIIYSTADEEMYSTID